MKTLKYILITTTIVLGLTTGLNVTVQGQSFNEVRDGTAHKIDSTYHKLMKKKKVYGVSLAIVDNGKIFKCREKFPFNPTAL